MKNKVRKVKVTPNNGSWRVRKMENGYMTDRTFTSKKKATEFRNALYA